MRWPRLPQWLRRHNGSAEAARLEAETKLYAARRATPRIEKAAERLADLPPDEFAARVAEAFRRRPA